MIPNLSASMLGAIRTFAKFERLNPRSSFGRTGSGINGKTLTSAMACGMLEQSYKALTGSTYYALTDLGRQVACADALERGRAS